MAKKEYIAEPEHDASGWYNFCRNCEGRIWLDASEIKKSRMTKFKEKGSPRRHKCLTN